MNTFNILTTLFFTLCCIIRQFLRNKEIKSRNLLSIIEEYKHITIAIIFLIGVVVRFYKLDQLPAGMHYDEVSIAYDTFCLMNYGVDRNLKPYSIYLISHGSGQNVLLLYLITISFRIFGTYGLWAIRFPTAAMGALSVLLIFFIVKKFFNNAMAIISALLMAIFPALINMSRFGLESYLMYSFLLLSTLMFIIAIQKQKAIYYFIAGLCYGTTLYTYAIAYMVIPVILTLSILYLLYFRKIKLTHIISMGIPVFILALPLMLMLAVNNNMISADIIPFYVPVMNYYRGGEVHFQSLQSIITGITKIFTFDDMTYNSHTIFKTMYMCSIPLTIYGGIIYILDFIKHIVKKEYTTESIVMFSFLASFAVIFLIDYANVNKMNAVYPFFCILIALALYKIGEKSDILLVLMLMVYMVNFTAFTIDYFDDSKYTFIQKHFSSTMDEPLSKIESLNNNAEKVYVCDSIGDGKIEFLSYAIKSHPEEFFYNEPTGSIDKYTINLPVWLDSENVLHEDINDRYIYMVQKDNMTETFIYIRNMLDENNFIKDSTTYYDIYYKNAN